MLTSTEHEISHGHKNKNTNSKTFLRSTHLSMLSWVEHEKKNQNFVFLDINKTNFMLSWVEHEKSFITSGPGP